MHIHEFTIDLQLQYSRSTFGTHIICVNFSQFIVVVTL